MDYRVALTLTSQNAKTGPIPVSTTDSSTCPPDCGQHDTCYAKFGPLAMHWGRVNSGSRGIGWDDFCDAVKHFPKGQLWRHNQAGDLPGDGVKIDGKALHKLVVANRGKRGFTYTHYPLSDYNLQKIRASNHLGFTINVSFDALKQVKEWGVPSTVVLPSDTKEKSFMYNGKKIVVCPATYRDDTTCWNCGICYESRLDRAVIGFPAHGTKKRVIDIRLMK